MAAVVSGAARVVQRESYVFSKLWRGNVFSSTVSPILFLTGMGVGLGGLIDERAGAVDGLAYLDFVAPGLLAGAAMQTAAAGSLWSVLGGMKWMRYYHGIVASPISPAGVFAGFLSWVALRVALSTSIFLVVAALLGGVSSWWTPLAVPAAMLTAVSFAAPIAAFTATQETDFSFPLLLRLVITPLFLFSETFFPLDQLPGWLQPAAWFSPLWHGVSLCRLATTGGGQSAGEALVHLAVLVGVVAVAGVIGARNFTRRLAS